MAKFLELITFLLLFSTCNLSNNNEITTLSKSNIMIAAVRKGNVWYFIDNKNKILFNSHYNYATEYSNGISCITQEGLRAKDGNLVHGAYFYAMDMDGNILPDIKSDQPFTFVDGYTIISYGEEKKLISKTGSVIRSEKLDGYGTFSEGLVPVFKDGLISFWNAAGQTKIMPLAITVAEFKEDFAYFLKDDKYGYIIRSGDTVVNPIYDDAFSFHNGYAVVKKGKDYFVLDKSFNEVLGPYKFIRNYSEGTFCIQTDQGWTYIDNKNNQVISDYYLEAGIFSDDLAVVRLENHKLALVNKENHLTNVDARVALPFKNGIAIAEKNSKMGYINKAGQWIIEPQFERVTNFVKKN